VLGICYGFQLMVSGLGGPVAHTGTGEYGATALERLPPAGPASDGADGGANGAPGRTLLSGLPARPQRLTSRARTCTVAPPGLTVPAQTAATPGAAVEAPAQRLYGVQFHPEVLLTEHGMEVLRRFLAAAGCRPDWTMRSVIDEQPALIAEQVGGA